MSEQWIKEADKQAKLDAKAFLQKINDNADDIMVERDWYIERVLYHFHRASKSGEDK